MYQELGRQVLMHRDVKWHKQEEERELLSLSPHHTSAAKLASTNKALEGRRAMDMEGFAADLSALRKMLTAVDRKLHEMRLVERWVAAPVEPCTWRQALWCLLLARKWHV